MIVAALPARRWIPLRLSVVTGLPDGRWVLLSSTGGRTVMTPVSLPAETPSRFGRLWWLPVAGHGNGLDDRAWAPALQISEQIVPQVLRALRDAGVPAYAAPVRAPGRRLANRGRRPKSYQLWVGASAYGRAEAALLIVMPQLAREAARRSDQAWR
jgi:hypothetical protein